MDRCCWRCPVTTLLSRPSKKTMYAFGLGLAGALLVGGSDGFVSSSSFLGAMSQQQTAAVKDHQVQTCTPHAASWGALRMDESRSEGMPSVLPPCLSFGMPLVTTYCCCCTAAQQAFVQAGMCTIVGRLHCCCTSVHTYIHQFFDTVHATYACNLSFSLSLCSRPRSLAPRACPWFRLLRRLPRCPPMPRQAFLCPRTSSTPTSRALTGGIRSPSWAARGASSSTPMER